MFGRNTGIVAVVVLAVFARAIPCLAIVPGSIGDRASESTVIVVAKLLKYTEDAEAKQNGYIDESHRRANGPPPFRWPGTYSFEVQTRLKGDCSNTLELWIKAFSEGGYGVQTPVGIPEGKSYLLFLNGTSEKLTTMARDMPIIPLGDNIDLAAAQAINDPARAAEALVLASWKDPRTRAVAMHVLEGTRDDAVDQAARQFIDDPDRFTQLSTLSCLATNQNLDAIPRIVQLERKYQQNRWGDGVVATLLKSYQTPKVVPQLNQLLMKDNPRTIRINACYVLTVNKLADQNSIPGLIEVLEDRSLPNDTAYQAHRELHILIPLLGPMKDRATFLNDPRDLEIEQAKVWWASQQQRHAPGTEPDPAR